MKNDQNKIGIIVADENEIFEFPHFMKLKKIYKNSQFEVKKYKFNKKTIFLIHSGIGLINAAIATQYLIDNFKVRKIWNYGAVGSSIKNEIFDIVIPKKFYYHDVITPWYKRGQIPKEKEFYLNSLVLNNMKSNNIGSSNSFINSEKYFQELQKDLDIDLIDMESTAIANVCNKNNIEFYCVKAVSDIVGKNLVSSQKINQYISKAAKISFEKMVKLIDKN